MKTNETTNPGMNVDDYENMAVQKSNTAKRVAAGAAMLVGGAAIGGGAAYAAADHGDDQPVVEDETLTAEDVVDGANVGNTYQESNESHSETVTERVVYVEKEPESAPEQESEPAVTWDEKTVVYDENGNVMGSAESGTVNGKDFALVDVDGDDHADYLAIDMDENHRFDDNEIVRYDVSDHMHMGHETAHTKEIHYQATEPSDDPDYIAQNDDPDPGIHNNFEDEKTGEEYHNDFAENNPDYNPKADVNDYGSGNYLAEDDTYHEDDSYGESMNQYDDMAEAGSYDGSDEYMAHADMDVQDDREEYLAQDDMDLQDDPDEYMAQEDMDLQDDSLESSADYTAEMETGDSYDDMVGGEEFLG